MKLFQDKKKILWYKLFCRCKGLFYAANFVIYMMWARPVSLVYDCLLLLSDLSPASVHFQMTVEDFPLSWTTEFTRQFFNCQFPS